MMSLAPATLGRGLGEAQERLRRGSGEAQERLSSFNKEELRVRQAEDKVIIESLRKRVTE